MCKKCSLLSRLLLACTLSGLLLLLLLPLFRCCCSRLLLCSLRLRSPPAHSPNLSALQAKAAV